jgi:anaerobic selenocysteine-containing dehydrogenase
MERLEQEHSVRLAVPDLPWAEGGFRTPSGKVDLSGRALAYEPPAESRLGPEAGGAFPLELVSSKNHDSMNSTFGGRDDVDRQTAVLQIHPDDAAPRGLRGGEAVLVFNARGSVELTCEVTPAVRPGVVRAPSVRWNKRSPGGRGVNLLTSSRLTDIGGGPTFYNCLVEVRPCAS